ncbi:hypothetical protein PWT90_08795 [Aphanocladium album]|nr:hypothetical protein PWT90_08795 [Aphanocladium album]
MQSHDMGHDDIPDVAAERGLQPQYGRLLKCLLQQGLLHRLVVGAALPAEAYPHKTILLDVLSQLDRHLGQRHSVRHAPRWFERVVGLFAPGTIVYHGMWLNHEAEILGLQRLPGRAEVEWTARFDLLNVLTLVFRVSE